MSYLALPVDIAFQLDELQRSLAPTPLRSDIVRAIKGREPRVIAGVAKYLADAVEQGWV